MGKYKIKYEDMYSLLWSFKSDMTYLIETVDNYKSALDSYLNTSAMSGQTADAVYNYFQEVHYVFLDSIKQIAQAFLDNFAGYKCGYYSIDLSTKFVLAEEGIEATVAKLADICEIFTEESAKVNSALNDIDSIDGVEHYEHPSDQGIPTSHDNLNTKLTELDTTISDFEATTVTSIDNSIETLMALFIKSLESLFVPSQVEPNRYVAGTFGENPYAAAEIYMNEILQENHDSNVEILNSIWENETELHELAEARKVQGIWKAVGGVALIVVGAACIVVTAGAATPLVVGGLVAGGGTIAFGTADLIEGGQDIYHGSTGDLDTSSFNYIRDTVFMGNQTAYDIVEEVFSFAAGAMIPIGGAYKAGSLTLRSGGVILGEEVLAEGAGFGGSYLAGKYTDNPTLQLLAGVGASMLVGKAGTMVDKRFNLSGNFPKPPNSPDLKLPSAFDNLPKDAQLKQLEALGNMSEADRKIYLQVANNEPQITLQLQEIAEKTGGRLEGLDYRLKTPTSTYEKMYLRPNSSTAITDMNDIIRYTEIFDPSDLAEGTNRSLREFEANGYRIEKVKNFWDNPNNPYNGINTTIVSPDGQAFEVQFHTQESFDIKNGKMHELYEQQRVLPKTDPNWEAVNMEMFDLSNSMTRPDNISEVISK